MNETLAGCTFRLQGRFANRQYGRQMQTGGRDYRLAFEQTQPFLNGHQAIGQYEKGLKAVGPFVASRR